jgi:hypothetical protein
MPKCGMRGCSDKVIGGFRERIDAGNYQDPGAEIPGLITSWCKAHESALRPTTYPKRGVELMTDQIPKD